MNDKKDIKELEKSVRIVDALYRVANFIGYVGDLSRLLELIMEESKQVMNAEASSLMLYDSNANELYFEVALGEKGDAVKQIRLKMGEGIAGSSAQDHRTIVVNDARNDPRHFKQADSVTSYTTRNLLATPMLRGDRLIGVLEVLNKHNDEPFTDEDIRVLEFFAGQAAIAIENTRLIQENMRSERLAAMGQAIASLSHYIKNVISGIEGSLSLMDLAFEQDDKATLNEIWPIFKRSTKRISRLVREMLSFSRPRVPSFSPVHINSICEDIRDSNIQIAQERNLNINLDLDANVPITLVDPEVIHDAILNMLSNSLDALGETGTQVTLITRYHEKEREIEIRIKDDGPGIPSSVQGKIFEPFFSTKGSKGTGLGLAIVKKGINEHGGNITLLSSPGEGATFIIILPYRTEEATNSEVTP